MTIFRFALGFGAVSAPGVDGAAVFDQLCEVSVAADEAGIDALFVPDHVWQNDRGGTGRSAPMLEAYTLLGALAARTSKVKLGALVSPVTFRNPAILAKTVTTLDVISHGRAILGLGAGWDDEEHVGYGIDFPSTGERMDRLEESLQIATAMFSEDAPTFAGRHYSIASALNVPRPISTPIPILVGGGGEKRTLRLVAQYADACNLFGDATTVRAKLDVLESHCEQIGRDSSTITKTAAVRSNGSTAELLDETGKLAAVGIDGFILAGGIPSPDDVHRVATALIAEFGPSV
jgi:F420-dependent oxidoreductase-like protein